MGRILTSYQFDELDFDTIVPVTQASYWGQGRTREGIVKSFRNAYSVGLRAEDGAQVGWARATSDTVYHAYIYDLQVLPDYRGRGLGTRLTQDLMAHPELSEVTGWMLSTRAHHGMYRKLGFKDADPGRYMSKVRSR
ncbi:MAG: GNAT family N-acetyltransferase [Pseudomonadota bacterium]